MPLWGNGDIERTLKTDGYLLNNDFRGVIVVFYHHEALISVKIIHKLLLNRLFLSYLYGDFQQIAIGIAHHAFVIAVAGDTRPAQAGIAVRLQSCRQLIHGLAAARTERQMDEAGIHHPLLARQYIGAAHDFQTHLIAGKRKEIRL